MASKFKKEIGQPVIKGFLGGDSIETKKKHTLPSIEKNPKKQQTLEDSEKEALTASMTEKDLDNMASCSNESDDNDVVSKEESAFEKRLTKSLSKLMKKELRSIKKDLGSLKNSQDKQDRSIQDLINTKEENVRLKRECERVLEENNKLRSQLVKIENMLLDNNVILHGIREDPWELESNRLEKVTNAISRTIDDDDPDVQLATARKMRIKSAKRVGLYSAKCNRPISVCFERYCDAEYVLWNKKYLPQGIFADKEYTEETENNRRILHPILRAAHANENYKGKCKMDGDILVLKGLSYTVNNLHKLPPELNEFSVSSKSDSKSVCFFGELNAFSNFNSAKFSIDGIEFHSSEQYIQYVKVRYFKDTSTATEILNTNTALQCKELSRAIRNFIPDHWNADAKDQCYPGIEAKFLQNEDHMKLLLETGDKKIAEASYDNVWGTGIPLQVSNCLRQNEWGQIGILGDILMEIRHKHRNIISGNTREEKQMDMISKNSTASV